MSFNKVCALNNSNASRVVDVDLSLSLKTSSVQYHDNNFRKYDLETANDVIAVPDVLTLQRKYFLLWQVTTKRETLRSINSTKTQTIDQFLETLKKQKEINYKNNLYRDKVHGKTEPLLNNAVKEQNVDRYKHRHDAQQNIIAMQKVKLLEQERVIQDLKLGLIRDDLERSSKNSKCDIADIFKNCSNRVKCKTAPPPTVTKDDVDVIKIRCDKAPKILRQMEKRAHERELKRWTIAEKKKLLDCIKRKQAEDAIENKKVADEELRQKNLRALLEKRKRDVELEKRRQLFRKKQLENLHRADGFRKRHLQRFGYRAFKQLIIVKEENELRSEVFYDYSMKKRLLHMWRSYTVTRWKESFLEAENLYNRRLRKKAFKSWNTILKIRRQSIQVSQDFYDMKLESKIFIHWYRYVCKQYMNELKKIHFSERHHNSRILVRYFYRWKSLSAVLQLEKGKEEQKQKWREKVLEILPDYNPVLGSEFFKFNSHKHC